ncbi:site-specific integrase [Streptomyces sp. NBC_01477]|uniref:site-specific integrase n=1 Tax=Streptomyces sp. NBC_01477 TaxID=2976015 RepID=UPI002E345C40|nr:site-specific integrase [Streptomyces sp. NBC_01477]
MASSRRAGGVTKRCECREGGRTGRRLGDACPLLSKSSHGTYAVAQELPRDDEGKRRTFRRTGYAKVKDANADLARIQSILELGEEDESDLRRIGDFLAGLMRDRADIPPPAAVAAKLGVGIPLDGKMTVGQWLTRWLANKKTRGTTTASYRSHVTYHLIPRIGHIRLDRLGVAHLDVLFADIAEAAETIAAENAARREQEARCRWDKPGRPPATAREQLAKERAKLAEMKPYRKVTGLGTLHAIRRTLRTALNAAIGQKLITFNAAAHVELTSHRRPQGLLWTAARVQRWRETGEVPSPVMVWPPALLGQFLDAAVDDRLYAFFHLMTHHGLRRGEAVGQDWAGVDWKMGTIAVQKEIVLDGGRPIETAPKTAGSQDFVQVDVETLAILREHREYQLAERDAWNTRAAELREKGEKAEDWVDTGKMFSAPDGRWLHPDVVSSAFVRIRDATGLPPVTLRDTRHGAAGLVKAGGGDMDDAKKKLRHSTIVLTIDTYMPLWAEYDAELAERSAAAVPRARRRARPAPAPAE